MFEIITLERKCNTFSRIVTKIKEHREKVEINVWLSRQTSTC